MGGASASLASSAHHGKCLERSFVSFVECSKVGVMEIVEQRGCEKPVSTGPLGRRKQTKWGMEETSRNKMDESTVLGGKERVQVEKRGESQKM